MKLLGRDVRLFSSAAKQPAGEPPQGEAGSAGDSRYSILLGSWDENDAWRGVNRWSTPREMARTSAACRAALSLILLTMRSALWQVKPATHDPLDKLAADYLAWNLGIGDEAGYMAQSWGSSVYDTNRLELRNGCHIEELVYADEPVEWRDADGDAHLLWPLARLAPRMPSSVSKIEWKNGNIERLEQSLPGTKPIPGDKLAYYVLDPEPGDWGGTSILRSAWGPWKLLKEAMVSDGIAVYRWGGGGLVEVRRPDGLGDRERDEAAEIGRSIQTDPEAYVSFEGSDPWEHPSGEGWGIKLHQAQLLDPTARFRWYSEQIFTSVLEMFAALGVTGEGSRAVGEVLAEPFYLSVQSYASDFARERVRQVFRRIVDVNFGPQVATPRLTVSKIQRKNPEVIARVASELAAAGFFLDDLLLQNYLRSVLEWPTLPEDWREIVRTPRPEGGGLGGVGNAIPPLEE